MLNRLLCYFYDAQSLVVNATNMQRTMSMCGLYCKVLLPAGKVEDYFGIVGDGVFKVPDCLFNCWLLSFNTSVLLCLSFCFPTS